MGSIKVVIDKDRLISLIKYRFKLVRERKTVDKLVEEILKENQGYPQNTQGYPELTTYSLVTTDFRTIENKLIGEIRGLEYEYGSDVHTQIKNMFNGGSDDYRKMPMYYKLVWFVKFGIKGVRLDLQRVNIEHNQIKPNIYWCEGGRKEDDTEHYQWVPLHSGCGKGGIIPTPVLGVHFNFAIKWFTENIVKEVSASYPIDIVDDTCGGWDLIQRA